MSNSNSSLAFEDIDEQEYRETELGLVVKAGHLFRRDQEAIVQPFTRMVKVSGNITVSF